MSTVKTAVVRRAEGAQSWALIISALRDSDLQEE